MSTRAVQEKTRVDHSRVDHSEVSKFERGLHTPSPQHLRALADAYGVDRHFVLLYAGYLELPGFEVLLSAGDEQSALDLLFKEASRDERRVLAKHLAWLRMGVPMIDEVFARREA